MRVIDRVRRVRELLADLQGAAWHLGALPSRQDLRGALRRTASLAKKVGELERLVEELEAIAERRGST